MMNLGKTLSPQQLAGMMDHTFLKASGLPGDIEKLCAEAVSYGFATVMVNPSEIAHCRKCLAGAAVPIGVTIGFPLGQNTIATKLYEAQDALGLGVRELDMVLNVRALQAGALDVVRTELADFARVCRKGGAKSKVILETCYLDDAQKQAACRLAVEAGLDFVKTSTGFGSGGATVADVRLMRDAVGNRAGVKASGGIRDLQTALAMVAAGATRLGTSNSVAIIEELRTYLKIGLNHDGLSFRGGQGGCSGGNTQGGLSPEQTTQPDAERHATRCGHGIFRPAAALLAGGQDRCGY